MDNKRYLLKVICISSLLSICTGTSFSQIKEQFDSIYYQAVNDSVERYIKSHPHRYKPDENRLKAAPVATINYTTEDGFGLFAGMVGQYRNGFDTSAPISTISAFGYISTKLSFRFGISGLNYISSGRSRLEYKGSLFNDNRYFWGVGYNDAIENYNKSKFSEFGANLSAKYRFNLSRSLNIAPIVGFNYYKASRFTNEELSQGLPTSYTGINAGLEISLDTRDHSINPERGISLTIQQLFYPRIFYNSEAFYKTSLTADFFVKGWKGAVFALDLFSESNYGDSPWFMWTPIGGETRMRGYYYGRYRDKNTIIAQLELRQNIYKGHGMVIWGGCANIFPSYKEMDLEKTLPNYGIGYRYNLGGNVFKLDVGFGKGREWGIMAGYNHAF